MAPSASDTEVIKALLRPVVRACLRRGILLQQVVSLLKAVFVEEAEGQLQESLEKVNTSRLSLMTGVHRTDVAQIYRHRELPPSDDTLTLVGRVISEWGYRRTYRNVAGKPRILSCDGERSDFFSLVRSVSKSINPATVLFELERSGAVVRTSRGLKLVRETKTLTQNEKESFEFLAYDIDFLTRALEENLVVRGAMMGNLHHRTDYDNVYLKHLPRIRRWLLERGRKFHKEARDFISRFDKDLTPVAHAPDEPAGGKVHLSAFSLIEPGEGDPNS